MVTKEGANASIGLGLAIVGAVCGTVLTNLATDSAAIKMAGLCLGAAIPPFVEAVGRWRPVRAGLALLVTVAAMLVTYSGALNVGTATGKVIVPAPWTRTPGVPAFEVRPAKLTCSPVCDGKVTVTSTGEAPVTVGTVDISGPAKAKFSRTDDCVGKTLEPGEDCSFEVVFAPAGATGEQAAQVVIRDGRNREEKAVELSGAPPPGRPDLRVSSQGLRCVLQPGETSESRDALRVFFRVSLTEATPGQVPDLVPVKVSSSRGTAVTVSTAVREDTGDPAVASLPLGVLDYGRVHSITITVDPGHRIAERSETNNVLAFRLTIPAKPTSRHATELAC